MKNIFAQYIEFKKKKSLIKLTNFFALPDDEFVKKFEILRKHDFRYRIVFWDAIQLTSNVYIYIYIHTFNVYLYIQVYIY